jgi:N-methylhydantoinase A
MSRWRVGVDSGGTFTDICLFEEDEGRVEVWKVSSTPDDPSRGIAQGVEEGMRRVAPQSGDRPAAAVSYFGHGTTVATNALIQHKGVPTGLVTTDGFRDLLEIGRQKRPDLYDIFADKPPTLVQRDLRLEVAERVRHDGAVEVSLDEEGVRAAARKLCAAGVSAIAISFLYSFVRPEHERRAKEIVREEYPEAFICTSHEIAPEFREFERLSTSVVNAYLGPVMKRYIDRLAPRLSSLGMSVTPHLTQSNGGVIGFETAAEKPVRTVLSGPSTGVVGAKAPMLDIHTVGAGGGSIAYVDSGGLLKVGPRSAGADPGPVCYGKGNAEPTVTDANIVLQTLNPRYLLGGRMPVRQDLSRDAIGKLAERLGLGLMETAHGIISVVTANMAKAIRVISVQRGHDPRDYTLMAFGGAGPLHAARLAKELDVKRILVPRNPGILCAMGLLLTDLRADFATTRLMPLEAGALVEVESAFSVLNAQADAWFAHEKIAANARRLQRTVDMRYAGQNYELAIPLPDGPITAKTLDLLAEGFAGAHQRMYGFLADNEPIQLVTFRLEATGLVSKATMRTYPPAGDDARHAIRESREVWLAESRAFVACPVYAREELKCSNRFAGPAIVEQMDATTVVLPGMIAQVDAYLNLILEIA